MLLLLVEYNNDGQRAALLDGIGGASPILAEHGRTKIDVRFLYGLTWNPDYGYKLHVMLDVLRLIRGADEPGVITRDEGTDWHERCVRSSTAT